MNLSATKNEDIYSHVVKKIKQLRDEKKLSQIAFSDKLDVKRVTLANIETRKQNPSIELLWKMSSAFAIGVTCFFPNDADLLANQGKTETLNFLRELEQKLD